MVSLGNKIWFSGSGAQVSFDELIMTTKKYVDQGSKLFIGTDSFISKQKVNFATAICLYGESTDNRYFFTKDQESLKRFKVLFSRIMEEVKRTVELADHLYSIECINPKNIEIHIDVSPFGMPTATAKFSEALQGYVTGAGYSCKVKPEAWASQSVADKHSK